MKPQAGLHTSDAILLSDVKETESILAGRDNARKAAVHCGES